ncbi:MAG TPA: rhodanese-like domain-containing protein [Candidatus Paceibacterota bacterium]|nr:rhodanese-like domain-containing protein [Verrucomicrobiota bacterium]HSA09764.1 rhodanese-like domain-containing protein [Candidatus Paceibacterota bacterium]
MNAHSVRILDTVIILIALGGLGLAPLRAAEPWSAKELKDPAALAANLADAKAPQPVILNIGSVEQIKGAVAIGPTGVQEKFDKLKQHLANLPRDKEVIIYCGCCPFRRCPNIRPAFSLLKRMKFTKARLLNLPTSLKDDWIIKGYPME